jgi:diguanylate cyclase (GGDEF)-like protein
MLLLLGGVSAGSVALSAAVPRAGIAFLISSILPFIISIAFYNDYTYNLFNIAFSFYLIYSCVLTFKIYKLIQGSIILKYENDLLVRDLEKSNKILKKNATHDPLTHAANRRLFEINLETAIKNAKAYQTTVALFYIDLDKFKIANDTYGHDVGDLILKSVIQKLHAYFRKEDMISRLGGDEFAIIIENTYDHYALEKIAQKICELMAIPIQTNVTTIHISASIGIALYPDHAKNSQDLIIRADRCMYQAKQNGGNQFYFHPQSEHANDEINHV